MYIKSRIDRIPEKQFASVDSVEIDPDQRIIVSVRRWEGFNGGRYSNFSIFGSSEVLNRTMKNYGEPCCFSGPNDKVAEELQIPVFKLRQGFHGWKWKKNSKNQTQSVVSQDYLNSIKNNYRQSGYFFPSVSDSEYGGVRFMNDERPYGALKRAGLKAFYIPSVVVDVLTLPITLPVGILWFAWTFRDYKGLP
jgi:hypothetical protein